MPKAHTSWKVLPHGALTQVEENILTVTGIIEMPLTELQRRMTIARLQDGRLIVFSAIALSEGSMQKIESYGTPAFLIVPNDKHRLDAAIWKARYPKMLVVAPQGSARKVAEVVKVDLSEPRFDDPNVQLVTVPGTGKQEFALLVDTPAGTTLVLNDLVGNICNAHGFGGWFLRMMKFAGDGPQIPLPAKWAMVKDEAALRAQFMKWAELPTLKRILVSHGDVIDFKPGEALRDLARTLKAAEREAQTA
jgi:hypothetical protein